VFLYAFDLIELNGDDLRRDPLQVRKTTLASIPSRSSGLLACLASLTQSRANSSNSDPDDMGAPPVKVPFVALNNAVDCTEFHCGLHQIFT
jgi:hypothetical protein